MKKHSKKYEAALKKIVEGVCYRNAARYFNL